MKFNNIFFIGSQQGQTILKSLSSNLQNEFYFEAYGKILNSFQIFQKNFSKEFINCLCIQIVEKTFAPDETILIVFFSKLLNFNI